MRKLLLAGLAFVCTTACTSDTSIPETVLGTKANRSYSPYALPRSTIGLVGSTSNQPTILNSVSELAPGKYRMAVRWPEFDARGQAYVDEIHAFITALGDAGITPYMNFVDTPPWARNCAQEDGCAYGRNSSPPLYEHDGDFANFISYMLSQFGPNSNATYKVYYFGVFNEPNTPQFDINGRDSDPVAVYSHFARIAADLVKAQGGLVVGPELAPAYDSRRGWDQYGDKAESTRWLNDYMTGEAGWETDVLSVHVYPGTGDPNDGTPGLDQGVAPYFDPAKVFTWPYGNWRFWVTEAGAASPDWIVDPNRQSYWVAKAYSDFSNYRTSHPGTRWDAVFAFQHWEHPYGPGWENPDFRHNYLDYVSESEWSKKPAYWCLRKLTHGYSPSALNLPSCSQWEE